MKSSDTVYAMGLFGYWYYGIGHALTFGDGFIAFLKGFLWPAFLVVQWLEFFSSIPKP